MLWMLRFYEGSAKRESYQRAGSANEVAEAVLWLLSPAASYVTGAILQAGGGR
jgi:NAD(P)-dependent dehydrogenase (short-subunit alcohol dehydrogenase family)